MLIIVVICVVILLIGIAAADNTSGTSVGMPTQITNADIFTWLFTNPPDFATGLIYLVLGLVGALVAVFGLVGGVVPKTAGQANLEEEMANLKIEEAKLSKLTGDCTNNECPPPNPEIVKALGTVVNDLRVSVTQERRKQFAQAAGIYLILGAVFAAMLAVNMLQAIVIGFGWTGVIGVLGLNQDHDYRSSKKDDVIDKLQKNQNQLIQSIPNIKKQVDDITQKVAAHQPQAGTERTEDDVQHNKDLSNMVGDLKKQTGSLLDVTLTNDALNNEVKLARML